MPRFTGILGKDKAFELYWRHVSSGRVEFYKSVGFDVVLGRREGVWVWSLDGRRLLDAHSNGGVYNLGHRHPEVVEVLREALDELDIGNHHLVSEQRALLAEELSGLMPGDLNRVTYSVGGGEAVDFAIKLARGYTGRREIVYARGAYHGTTGLAIVAGEDYYKKPFEPLAPGFKSVPFGDADAIEAAVTRDTAAVLLETIPATLGMPMPPDDYYKRIREICDEKGCLLILDEIQTGLGRTGRLWGFEHYGVIPDIVVLGKGLSGGIYPISATVYRDELDDFMRRHPFTHISTFGGSELGCIVARKVLEITTRRGFLENVRIRGEELRRGLLRLVEEYPSLLEEVRGIGLFIGFKTRDEAYGPLLSLAAINSGLLAVYANNDRSVLQVLPPLIIDGGHVEYIIESLRKAVAWVYENRELASAVRSLIP
ncbi:MAG: aspartate aminotransferase family protein [Desulfurococcales archaeon]|nr:aspartate aminotransferase family protein [Desulfurococcales archaeon]